MLGARIDAFYGHDDQIGPFAKIKAIPIHIKDRHKLGFSGTWKKNANDYACLYPIQVIIPVYNKIRVNFTDVQAWLIRLDDVIKIVMDGREYEWDLHLTTTNKYKSEIRSTSFGGLLYRKTMTMRQHPRFLWRALLRTSGVVVLEFLFDATDIPNSFTGYCCALHDEEFLKMSATIFHNQSLQTILRETLTDKLLTFLKIASKQGFHVQNLEPCGCDDAV